jgi:hypothetical protein
MVWTDQRSKEKLHMGLVFKKNPTKTARKANKLVLDGRNRPVSINFGLIMRAGRKSAG